MTKETQRVSEEAAPSAQPAVNSHYTNSSNTIFTLLQLDPPMDLHCGIRGSEKRSDSFP